MRYYEIRDMNEAALKEGRYRTRVIDDDEMNRRLMEIIDADHDLEKSKEILLHGNVQEPPDPWEEWAEELTWAIFNGHDVKMKAGLLKLRDLVEKNTGCDSTRKEE